MWKLLKYMKGYKKEAFLAPAFKLLEALLELFVPLVMAAIIDVGIKNGDTGYIFQRRQLSGLPQGCAMSCLHIFRAFLFPPWISLGRRR